MNGFLMLLIKGYFGKAKIYPCEIKWDIKANNFLIIFLSLIFLICVEPYKLGSCAIGATEKNQTVNSLISQGNRLFKEKNYKEAIPIIINLLENYEKAYSKANFREITYFRTRLAGYYRWIQKNPNKAIKQYSKLITYLETIKSKRNISFQIWLLMGEVYEKDLKEYEKAKHCYEKAIEQVTPDIKKDKASKAVIDWLKFLSEKTNILYLKNNQQFSKRILKYPSIDYLSFSFPYSAFSEISFIEEDFMNNSSSYYSIEKFEKLSTKYPNSYQLMSLGIVIFYHFLEEKDFKNALIVADRLFETYIYEINMIRLYFKVAEIYQEQKNTQEHHRYMVQGKKLAKSINVDLVFGPDTRFSSPEKTWQLFISSIEKDDLNAIAECFSPDSMVLQQNSISKSKNRLNVMGSDNMQLTIKVEENKIFVEYRFQRIVKGKTQTYGVSFSNIFEEWKIDGLDLRFIRFLEWENSDTSN